MLESQNHGSVPFPYHLHIEVELEDLFQSMIFRAWWLVTPVWGITRPTEGEAGDVWITDGGMITDQQRLLVVYNLRHCPKCMPLHHAAPEGEEGGLTRKVLLE